MNLPARIFDQAETILDVGGWFKPERRATHVVDLMPWETRGARLSLTPLPDERFSKATWFQADFLKPGFVLPFANKSFDLVVCGHTIEDLVDPEPLLQEMQRIGKRGVIECPSRLTEQTKGLRDRRTSLPGHPHHHWIVESSDKHLLLYSKQDSALHSNDTLLPLSFTEKHIQSGAEQIVLHFWADKIKYRFIRGPECQQRAREFVASMQVPAHVRRWDSALRFGRRLRSKLRREDGDMTSWWPKIVEASRPYSTIELK